MTPDIPPNSVLRLALSELRQTLLFVGKWLVLSIPLGILAGSACALFLWSLDLVTSARHSAPWLVYLLPVAGLLSGWMYLRWGSTAERGNNLIIDEIHQPGGGVPLRMAPLVLLGTLLTHLCGGSAGREGTAVQMGGSLAAGWARLIPGLTPRDVRHVLMAGIAAGFGGVFGTPLAGTVFALEVLIVGQLHTTAILPCVVAALVADQTCLAWGIEHTHYHLHSSLAAGTGPLAQLNWQLLSMILLAGASFGLVSRLFVTTTHAVQNWSKQIMPWPVWRPAVGGCLVILLMILLGTRDYLGLGVTSPDPQAVTILSCFQPGGAQVWSWLVKLVLTAVTVGFGFKGGEVTPLFFIGAAAGNAVAIVCGGPVDLFAACGFLAVFAGATNTPLACTIMGIELFGAEYTAYFAVSCAVSYLFSGQSGIYSSQRVHTHSDNPTVS